MEAHYSKDFLAYQLGPTSVVWKWQKIILSVQLEFKKNWRQKYKEKSYDPLNKGLLK